MPDVFVVGAAKSGTTALYTYFKMHPQVFVPACVKETNYMAFCDGLPPLAGPLDRATVGDSVTSLAEYERLYGQRSSEIVAADVSPAYLYYPQASQRIARWAPQARIVMILRNPVECVLSMYSMMRRDGREPCHSLVEAFERSEERIAAGWEWAWDYKNGYKFAKQVERYTKRYPPSQLFIRRYEQLQREPERFYRELTEFLGISAIDVTDSNQRVNAAPRRVDILRQTRGGRVWHRAGRILGRVLPPRFATAIQRRFDAPAFTLKRAERRFLVDHFAQTSKSCRAGCRGIWRTGCTRSAKSIRASHGVSAPIARGPD